MNQRKSSQLNTTNKRELKRKTLFSASHGITLELILNKRKIECSFKNFTFSGACIFLNDKTNLNLKDNQRDLKVNIIQGNIPIASDIPFKIIWENKSVSHCIGLEFLTKNIPYEREDERYETNKNFPPRAIISDPVESLRKIYGNLIDLSINGFSAMCSLSNKHLFVGMKCSLSIDFIDEKINIKARIQRIIKDNDYLIIGFKVIDAEEYHSSIKKYLAKFCLEYPFDQVNSFKHLSDAITFYRIDTESDYEEIAKLRHDSYASKNKLGKNHIEQLSPGLINEGIVVGGYLQGKLICSMEYRGKPFGHKLQIEEYVDIGKVKNLNANLFEVNKMCISQSLQRSDVLLAILKNTHLLALNNDCCDGILSCTKKLLPFYIKLGARDTGTTYPNPHAPGSILHVLRLDSDMYLQAKNINPLTWELLFQDNHSYATERNLVSQHNFSLWKKMLIRFYLFNYKRSNPQYNHTKNEIIKTNEYTKPDFAVQIIRPYLVAASKLSSKSFVDKSITELGFNWGYFESNYNWVSVDFFDKLLDVLNQKIDLDELNINAGKILVSKEYLGTNYYMLKYLSNVNTLPKNAIKTSSKYNKNRTAEAIKGINNSLIFNLHLKDGCRLPKHRSTDLNFVECLRYGIALLKGISISDVTVEQISSNFDNNGPTSFKITWENKFNIKKVIPVSLIFILSLFCYIFEFITLIQLTLLILISILLLHIFTYILKKNLRQLQSYYSSLEEFMPNQQSMLYKAQRKLEDHNSRLQIISIITEGIYGTSTTYDLLKKTTDLICNKLYFSRSTIMLVDKEGILQTRAIYNLSSSKIDPSFWKFTVDTNISRKEEKVISTAFNSRQTIFVENVSQNIHSLKNESVQIINSMDIKSYVIIPIFTKEDAHGVIIVDKGEDSSKKINALEIQTLEEIATTLAIAINKQKKFDELNHTLGVLKKYNPKIFKDNAINLDQTQLKGVKKEVVSGFLDIRGYTTLADQNPPDVIIDLLNSLVEYCEQFLDKTYGHIDSINGDCIYFTWEDGSSEQMVKSAINTTFNILKNLKLLNKTFTTKGYPEIKIGVGLERGIVTRGNIGTANRLEYTSIGNSVNKASRYQELNKKYRSVLIIGEMVFKFLPAPTKDLFKKENTTIRGYNNSTENIYILYEIKEI